MKSTQMPTFDEVSSDLGAEVLNGFGRAVTLSRADLTDYRNDKSKWVSDSSERGLANWIHDRMIAHLKVIFDEHPDISIFDNGVTREILIGTKYRVRAKRHDEDMKTRNYPTQEALAFSVQPTLDISLEQFSLTFGYVWKQDLREIGNSVLAMHNDDSLLWWAQLGEDGNGWTLAPAVASPVQPDVSGPGFTIELPNIAKKEREVK